MILPQNSLLLLDTTVRMFSHNINQQYQQNNNNINNSITRKHQQQSKQLESKSHIEKCIFQSFFFARCFFPSQVGTFLLQQANIVTMKIQALSLSFWDKRCQITLITVSYPRTLSFGEKRQNIDDSSQTFFTVIFSLTILMLFHNIYQSLKCIPAFFFQNISGCLVFCDQIFSSQSHQNTVTTFNPTSLLVRCISSVD